MKTFLVAQGGHEGWEDIFEAFLSAEEALEYALGMQKLLEELWPQYEAWQKQCDDVTDKEIELNMECGERLPYPDLPCRCPYVFDPHWLRIIVVDEGSVSYTIPNFIARM